MIAALPQMSNTLIFGSPVVPWLSCHNLGATIRLYVCKDDKYFFKK